MRKIIATLVTAAFLVPALAFAADPAKNSHFRWCKGDRCSLTFNTSKDGRYIQNLAMYNKCAELPANYPRIRVRNGRFSKSGSVKNVVGKTVEFAIKGRFTRARKAVGTFDADMAGCNARVTDFVARRVGKAG